MNENDARDSLTHDPPRHPREDGGPCGNTRRVDMDSRLRGNDEEGAGMTERVGMTKEGAGMMKEGVAWKLQRYRPMRETKVGEHK